MNVPNGLFFGSCSRWEKTLLASFWMYESLEARSMSTKEPLIRLKQTNRNGNFSDREYQHISRTHTWGKHGGAERRRTGRSNTIRSPPSGQLCSCRAVGCLVRVFSLNMASLKSALVYSTRVLAALKRQVSCLFVCLFSTSRRELWKLFFGADLLSLQTHVVYIKRTLLLPRLPLFKRAEGKNDTHCNQHNDDMGLQFEN